MTSLLTLSPGETSVQKVVTIVRQIVRYLNGLTNTGPTVWTPTDQSGAGLTFTATTANSCSYYMIGKLVVFTFDFSWPATANGVTALIGGLPAIASATGTNAQSGVVNLNTAGTWDRILIFNNATTFAPCTSASTSPTNAQMTAARLRGSGAYFTS